MTWRSRVQNRHLPQSGIPIDPDAGQDRCALCTTVSPRGRERETHPWRQNKKRKKIMLKLVPISSAGFQQNLSHVLSANSPLFCVCVGVCGCVWVGVWVCVGGCVCVCVWVWVCVCVCVCKWLRKGMFRADFT